MLALNLFLTPAYTFHMSFCLNNPRSILLLFNTLPSFCGACPSFFRQKFRVPFPPSTVKSTVKSTAKSTFTCSSSSLPTVGHDVEKKHTVWLHRDLHPSFNHQRVSRSPPGPPRRPACPCVPYHTRPRPTEVHHSVLWTSPPYPTPPKPLHAEIHRISKIEAYMCRASNRNSPARPAIFSRFQACPSYKVRWSKHVVQAAFQVKHDIHPTK